MRAQSKIMCFQGSGTAHQIGALEIDKVDSITFADSFNPDTLYLHETLKQLDANQLER